MPAVRSSAVPYDGDAGVSDYLGHYFGLDGYKIVGLDGYCWDPDEFQLESESELRPVALDMPTIDIEPESVRDNEIHHEIER
jgi:hypothetical protein